MAKQDVYMIRNIVNGKSYIGSSITPIFRIKCHFSKLENGKHSIEDFQTDFDKYGKEAFECRILIENAESNMEYFMMKLFKTQNREYGYNYKDNGGNSPYAIASKWRIPTFYWTKLGKASFHKKYPKQYAEIDWSSGKAKKNDKFTY